MKIALTVVNDLVTDQRMQRIAETLTHQGHQVTLIGRVLPSSPPAAFPYAHLRWRCVFNKGPFFYLEHNLRLLVHCFGQRYDAVWAADLDTLPAAIIAKSLRRLSRVVYDAHEWFTEVPELLHRPKVRRVWQHVADWAIPKADAHVTVSQGIAVALSQRHKVPFRVVMNCPVLSPWPQHNPPPGPPIILYQGALNIGRGLAELIIAAQSLDVQVWMAGSGDIEADLRKLAAQFPRWQTKYRFLGRLSPAQLRAITPHAWLGYNLLADMGLSYRHSLSNKFFDYMHAGIPSLSNPWPEYQRILSQHSVGITANPQPAEIVKAVQALASSPASHAAMRSASHAARLSFCWGKEEIEIENIIAQL